MILARVVGAVVASAKNERLVGSTLVLCRPLDSVEQVESLETPATSMIVAVDLVGSSAGSVVLVCTGSSAQSAAGGGPVDAAVVGLVDYVTGEAGKRNPAEE